MLRANLYLRKATLIQQRQMCNLGTRISVTNQTILKDQAPFSFMTELNSSASSEYDWYVEGSSIMGPQVLIIGLRPAPSSILNVTNIDSHVITLLPVKNEKN